VPITGDTYFEKIYGIYSVPSSDSSHMSFLPREVENESLLIFASTAFVL